MIIVHDTFICKPGNASRLAKLFKETMAGRPEVVNIMSDLTGQFNRVILITQYENLSEYEKSWDNMDPAERKKMEESMKGYTEMYQTGSREIFNVW
jgi:predicted translin family RNA/ssDNA-binding protein